MSGLATVKAIDDAILSCALAASKDVSAPVASEYARAANLLSASLEGVVRAEERLAALQHRVKGQ